MTFKVGDEVKYTRVPLLHDGVVVEYDQNLPRPYLCRWDRVEGIYHTWEPKENLVLVFKELPYDPAQQGDREDDI
jgi:hypothetical protein